MSRKIEQQFQNLLETIPKEEFELYYSLHSKKESLLHFNINNTVWNKYLKYYGIKKSKDDIYEVRKATNIEKFGVENTFQDVARVQRGCINKYGSLEECHKKSRETLIKNNLEKYGVESVLSLQEVIDKRNETISGIPDYYKNKSKKTFDTKLERYGDGGYHNIEKMKKTNLDRYGVECNFASSDESINGRKTQMENWGHGNFNNREKAMQTCKERYGDDYYIKQIQLALKSLEKSSVSKPNKYFSAYLSEHCIKYETEFTVERFVYDFKVGKYLIEIDPWATHSSSFAPSNWKPKTESYHREKTLSALKEGLVCVHLFDWVDVDAIMYGIINESLRIIDTNKPVKHIYDTKENKLTNKENENTVIIYDDGFEVVY